MKALVAYFSCTNTTKNVAKTIAQVVDGDMYPIQPKIPYTRSDLNWNDAKSRSSLEMKDLSSRPEIIKDLDIDEYDIIFIGFPIWWYVAPTIIYSFLENYDFRGKTIVPFATSGGEVFNFLVSANAIVLAKSPKFGLGGNSNLKSLSTFHKNYITKSYCNIKF